MFVILRSVMERRMSAAIGAFLNPRGFNPEAVQTEEAAQALIPQRVNFPAGRYFIQEVTTRYGDYRVGYDFLAAGVALDGQHYLGIQLLSRFQFMVVEQPRNTAPRLIIAENPLEIPVVEATSGIIRVNGIPYKLKRGRSTEVSHYWRMGFEDDGQFARGVVRIEYPNLHT
jgi:hypothetical protein